jgi:putative hemolysin
MIIFEIIIILGLICLNGYFALAEIALLSVKKSHLQYLVQQGNKKAKKVLFLTKRSPEMLSTIQIAITAVGIFAGAFGGATVAKHLGKWFLQYEILAPYSEAISVAIVVLLITYVSLVIGELVPKQIALSHPEKFALKVSGTVILLMKITNPLVKTLSISTKGILKLFRIRPIQEKPITEEEIKLLMAEGVKTGTFEKSEFKMVENIFHLGNRPIKDFMTPKKEILWIDINDSLSSIETKIKSNEDITIFPVQKENNNQCIGAIETNDILNELLTHNAQKFNLKKLIQKVMYIDANTPSMTAIDQLRKSSIKIAFVSNKNNGNVLGIISFHDILEAIVGEFRIKDQ